MGRQQQQRGIVGEKSTFTGRDHHTLRAIVSKNHRTTAAQVTAELNIYLDDPVSTKTDVNFIRKPTI
jgi:hypothetical protein